MTDKTVDALLRKHEGVRHYPYRDSVGKLTIGVGFNLDDVGLYPEEIDFILGNRITLAKRELREKFPVFRELGSVRQTVLVDMIYNLGYTRLAAFTRMWEAINARDFTEASVQMLDSLWAKQVGPRARRLAKMMRTGEWDYV